MTSWRKVVRAYFYLILPFALMLVAAPRTTICIAPGSGSAKIATPMLNHTVKSMMMKKKFLETIKNRLMSDKNNSINQTQTKWTSDLGTLIPKSLNSSALPATSTRVPSVSLQIYPEQDVDSTSNRRSNNIVVLHSDSQKRNMLRFQLQLGSLGNKYVHRIMLMVYVWTKSPRKKKRTAKATRSSDSSRPSADYMKQIKMRKRREGRMIKIRIFMSDAKRTRGKRIAELKKRVKESEWQKLFLPLSLARTFSGNASNSNTLHLRIECKRCIGRTQLLIPGNIKCKNRRSMRNKKRTRRRRKFCSWLRDNDTSTFVPFMVMETKDKIRFKRASEMEAADSEQSFTECTPPKERNTKLLFESNPSLTNKNSRQQCCTTSKMFIQFRDLGLDDIIVSPSGFDYVTCTDECPGNNSSVLLHGNKLSLNRSLKALARKIRATLTKNGSRASQKTGLGSQGSGLLIHSQYLHKPHNHWHSHKWIRSKIKQGCQPAETQSLVILHFTHDHRLTTSILPHFLITLCECKGHLP